ncbi:serine/arginine repetitive matrix protein 2-like [Leguminivora glycinivorella]|uniref:serine/arginine repetitive matrix protein 2-like n=1 Tax=Leguminivora glycinivorella TaxID=1035111 RepID=UPI00200DD28F|nr:serine/arginine repetitive matrix protein 2-like [Leguminivora glycinivorella]
MTVRLSALFTALWEAHVPATASASASGSATRVTRHARCKRIESHAESMNGDIVSQPPSPDRPDLELNSDSSSSEPLAALAQARLQHPDSSDSDVPLRAHRKGKGTIVLFIILGKKTKIANGHVPTASPEPGPAYQRDTYIPSPNGLSSSSTEQIEVEQLSIPADDASLTYDEDSPAHEPSPEFQPRARRKRARDSDSAPSPPRRRHRDRHRHRHRQKLPKRTRERFTDGSSQSSSSNSEHSPERDGQRRYESDHSYHPRCSSDDEPLQRYRERQENDASQGEYSGTSRPRPSHSRRGGVKLRVRRPARYNEDSEEDSGRHQQARAAPRARHSPPPSQPARRSERSDRGRYGSRRHAPAPLGREQRARHR